MAEGTGPSEEELILSFLMDGGEEHTSAEALADKLGLSPSAVWKRVESLRRKGFRIDAGPARGYRLVDLPEQLPWEELSALIGTHDVGRVIYSYEEVDSTNDVARQLAVEGAAHGELVIAEQQLKGKGRRGRSWFSPPGKNLYFSIILRPDLPAERAPELTFVSAVAVAETLRELGVKAEIKWPNDILVEGKKLGGLLLELGSQSEGIADFVILGIGLNVNALDEDFPPELQHVATSLLLSTGKSLSRPLVASRLWNKLEEWLDRHGTEGFEPVRQSWSALSSTLGTKVRVKTDTEEWEGNALGIDASGALVVQLPGGESRRVVSADVETLRPSEPPDGTG
jgi:BirA family biotin operon repressor/biotin-[acetyl-CoA-carboxylase] ligase